MTPPTSTGFPTLHHIHVDDLRAALSELYDATTRSKYVRPSRCGAWLDQHLNAPNEITKPILPRTLHNAHLYQQTRPAETTHSRSVAARAPGSSLRALVANGWARQKLLALSIPPVNSIYPKARHRLPKATTSPPTKTEQVLATPNITEPLGVRDREHPVKHSSTDTARAESTHVLKATGDAAVNMRRAARR